MVRSVFRPDSGLLNGISGFIAPATAAVIGLAFARVAPRRAMTIGIYASMVGAIVSYIAFGVPIVIAGQLTDPLGLVPTVVWYTALTVLLALISLIAQIRINVVSEASSDMRRPALAQVPETVVSGTERGRASRH
jgi:hypothetical protein